MKVKRSKSHFTKLSITLTILIVLSIIAFYYFQNTTTNSNENIINTTTQQYSEQLNCQAKWASQNLTILDSLGDIYILRTNNNGTSQLIESMIYVLEGYNITVDMQDIHLMETLLSNKSIISILSDSPISEHKVISIREGYKIFLPKTNGSSCINYVLRTLYPNINDLQTLYLGETVPPYNDTSWIYYNRPLPSWKIYYNGEPVSIVWIDPDLGVIVAEMQESALYLWVQVLVGDTQ